MASLFCPLIGSQQNGDDRVFEYPIDGRQAITVVGGIPPEHFFAGHRQQAFGIIGRIPLVNFVLFDGVKAI